MQPRNWPGVSSEERRRGAETRACVIAVMAAPSATLLGSGLMEPAILLFGVGNNCSRDEREDGCNDVSHAILKTAGVSAIRRNRGVNMTTK